MSLVISVQAFLPWAHPWEDAIASSRSDASSKASIVTVVCSSSSRIAPRTVAAIGPLQFLRILLNHLVRPQQQRRRDGEHVPNANPVRPSPGIIRAAARLAATGARELERPARGRARNRSEPH